MARLRGSVPRRRWLIAAALALVLLLPVPWLHVAGDNPFGWQWRLDGRLVVNDEVVDPPGAWSWLTVGRPPLVVEVLRDELLGTADPARDLRVAPIGTQPRLVEPVAAAVGLREAGYELTLGLVVEVAGPTVDGLPLHARITGLNGVELDSRIAWNRARAAGGPTIHFTTADGRNWSADGPVLPYSSIRVVDLGPEGVQAAIGGRLARLAPVDWFRSLSLGNSHGMMVALVTYAHFSGEDLARDRHVAGTGGVRGDGTVTRIAGLRAKASAARRAGADVLLIPASQRDELANFDSGSMRVVAVSTVPEAIDVLRG
ncbi:MAG: S16 family serine protease [Nitriliruptoraceae bacterium]